MTLGSNENFLEPLLHFWCGRLKNAIHKIMYLNVPENLQVSKTNSLEIN